MSEPIYNDEVGNLDPVHQDAAQAAIGRWTQRLVLFLRIMAALAMLKGLYHWTRVCGIGVGEGGLFQFQPVAWQVATVFFAVIDLVAAVGLWLAAAWGAVIWLMSVASMLAVEIFFPQVFGVGLWTGMTEGALLAIYLLLALKSAQEHPQG